MPSCSGIWRLETVEASGAWTRAHACALTSTPDASGPFGFRHRSRIFHHPAYAGRLQIPWSDDRSSNHGHAGLRYPLSRSLSTRTPGRYVANRRYNFAVSTEVAPLYPLAGVLTSSEGGPWGSSWPSGKHRSTALLAVNQAGDNLVRILLPRPNTLRTEVHRTFGINRAETRPMVPSSASRTRRARATPSTSPSEGANDRSRCQPPCLDVGAIPLRILAAGPNGLRRSTETQRLVCPPLAVCGCHGNRSGRKRILPEDNLCFVQLPTSLGRSCFPLFPVSNSELCVACRER